MASATTIRISAIANVVRMPVVTASGRAVVMSIVADASANTAPITDAPVMSPKLREKPLRRVIDLEHYEAERLFEEGFHRPSLPSHRTPSKIG